VSQVLTLHCENDSPCEKETGYPVNSAKTNFRAKATNSIAKATNLIARVTNLIAKVTKSNCKTRKMVTAT